MSRFRVLGLILPIAALSIVLILGAAEAQTTGQTAPQPAKPIVVTPPAAKPEAAPANKAPATAKSDVAPKKAATAAPSDKPPSACKGLEEKPCRMKSADCYWIAATKRKDGTDVKAFCRAKSKSAKKATDAVAKAPAAPVPPAKPSVKPAPKTEATAPAASTGAPAPKASAEKTK